MISKLFEIVDSIRLSNEIQKSNSEKVNERYSFHESIYNENLDGLRKLNDETLGRFNQGDISNNPSFGFMKTVLSVFKKWQDEDVLIHEQTQGFYLLLLFLVIPLLFCLHDGSCFFLQRTIHLPVTNLLIFQVL